MRTLSRLILCAVLAVVTLLLGAAACYLPETFFSFYTGFSQKVLGAMASVTGAFPFALWEALLVLVVLLALFFLFKNRHLLAWLSGVALFVCTLVLAFTALWGLNHFAPPVSQRLGLEVGTYSKEQLAATTAFLAQKAGQWADQVPREADGTMTVDLSRWAKAAPRAYDGLARQDPFFDAGTAPVKPLLSGKAFSYMGTTGIFIAFTGESCINPNTFSASLPFTMCHEVAHRLTVAPEEEANFCAFLACTSVQDPAFQYSGWYSAFVYGYNALSKADPQAAQAIWEGASPTLREDCRRANLHYAPYEGQVQEAAQKANDVYLKAFQEEAGVESYGLVTDLLIAWYLSQG